MVGTSGVDTRCCRGGVSRIVERCWSWWCVNRGLAADNRVIYSEAQASQLQECFYVMA